ncbi:hypothetical protein MRX96_031754 [Rhipicephalus microplus]
MDKGLAAVLKTSNALKTSHCPRPSAACAIPVVMLAPLWFQSSSLVFSYPDLGEDPARITRGSHGWDWRRVPRGKVAAMFLRGFVHVPDPVFDRCRGSSSAVSSTLQAKSVVFISSFTSTCASGGDMTLSCSHDLPRFPHIRTPVALFAFGEMRRAKKLVSPACPFQSSLCVRTLVHVAARRRSTVPAMNSERLGAA